MPQWPRCPGLGATQHRRDIGDLLAAGPHGVGRGADVDAGQRGAVGAFHPVVEHLRAQHRWIGQREPDGRDARMPVGRPHAVADSGQVAVESAAVRRDAADRVTDPLLRGGALAGEYGRLGLAVLTSQPRDLAGEPLFFRAGQFGGGARLAASLHRRARGTHRVGGPPGRGQQDAARVVAVGVEHAGQRPVGPRQRDDVVPVAFQVLQRLGGIGDRVLGHRRQRFLQPAREIGVDPIPDPRVADLMQQREDDPAGRS